MTSIIVFVVVGVLVVSVGLIAYTGTALGSPVAFVGDRMVGGECRAVACLLVMMVAAAIGWSLPVACPYRTTSLCFRRLIMLLWCVHVLQAFKR